MVTKQVAELLRKIKVRRDILQAGNVHAVVLEEVAEELKGLLAELKSEENINNEPAVDYTDLIKRATEVLKDGN